MRVIAALTEPASIRHYLTGHGPAGSAATDRAAATTAPSRARVQRRLKSPGTNPCRAPGRGCVQFRSVRLNIDEYGLHTASSSPTGRQSLSDRVTQPSKDHPPTPRSHRQSPQHPVWTPDKWCLMMANRFMQLLPMANEGVSCAA